MTRLGRTLERDLRHIADRATPSPDAWESILSRIADQGPNQETEIIMLTENTMPTRRWPLFAAAAAVIALAVAGVVYTGIADEDDPQPLDTVPTPTPVVDPDQPAPETDADAVDEDPIDVDADANVGDATRTVTLTGTTTSSYDFGDPDAEGVSTFSGTEQWTGPLVNLRGEATGSGVFGETIAEGTVSTVLSGLIEGVGSGTLTVEGAWTSDETTGLVGTTRVIGGTRDFEGATGTSTLRSDSTRGTFELVLTLPAAAFDPDFVEPTPPDVSGDVIILTSRSAGQATTVDDRYEATGAVTGDIVGTFSSSGDQYFTPGEEGGTISGIGRSVTDISIEGLGDGTLEWIEWWYETSAKGTGLERRSTLVGATGALEGFSGTQVSTSSVTGEVWSNDTTLVRGAPRRTVSVAGTWTDADYTEVPGEGDLLETSYVTRFEGGLVGQGPATGVRLPSVDGGPTVGGGTIEFAGTIDGLGTGTLTIEEAFTSSGTFLSVGVVTGGTGDLAGAQGTLVFDHGTPLTYRAEISVPTVAPPTVDTTTVTVDATTSEIDFTPTVVDDGTETFTGRSAVAGGLQGDLVWVGGIERDADGNAIGDVDLFFDGEIDGVGSGMLTLREINRNDAVGTFVSTMLVIGGTDDFAGASGVVRLWSTDTGATRTSTWELRLPAG